MKKALIVGVDYYEHIDSLSGCVSDAYSVNNVLERHADGTKNFDTLIVTANGSESALGRNTIREHIEQLFSGSEDTAILYFAGHGYIESTGGYLCASDTAKGHDGIPLGDVMAFANASRVRNKIIILDCCHSGVAGNVQGSQKFIELTEGTTILTASTSEQYADETPNGGVFTNLFVDAMNGAAGNLIGDVTPGSVYAHIDQSLGSWQQRPVFKTNVHNFVSLRKVSSPITILDLQKLIEFFPVEGGIYALDPSYEPHRAGNEHDIPAPDPLNIEKLKVLQKLNRVNLVVPVDAEHMWNATMESKGCRLTVLGEHYRGLVAKGHI